MELMIRGTEDSGGADIASPRVEVIRASKSFLFFISTGSIISALVKRRIVRQGTTCPLWVRMLLAISLPSFFDGPSTLPRRVFW